MPNSVSTAQIGSTPNRSLYSAMTVTRVAVEGRAPSRRKSKPPSKFQSHDAIRGFRVQAHQYATSPHSSAPAAPQHPAPPDAPTGAASPPSPPPSPRSTGARPTATNTALPAQTPPQPRVHAAHAGYLDDRAMITF